MERHQSFESIINYNAECSQIHLNFIIVLLNQRNFTAVSVKNFVCKCLIRNMSLFLPSTVLRHVAVLRSKPLLRFFGSVV